MWCTTMEAVGLSLLPISACVTGRTAAMDAGSGGGGGGGTTTADAK